MKIYDHNGYANMSAIIEAPYPFILCVGGRGTGKTYSSIKYLLEQHVCFIYLRRTMSQMELVSKPEFCPVVYVGEDIGMSLTTESITKYVTGVYHTDDQGSAVGVPIAYIMALSTIANTRSFNATGNGVTHVLYDECVPEQHERNISHEAEAFWNMYETLDRNRQLDGKPALKCVCLANANNLSAPILTALRAVRPLEDMRNKGLTQKEIKTTGLFIVLLKNSPISAEKAQTALYRLTMGQDDFNAMAISNDFGADNYTDIKQCPIAEFRPVAAIGEICVYRHKSQVLYYVSDHISGTPKMYDNTISNRQRFRRDFAHIWSAYLDRKVWFDSAHSKIYFKAIMLDNLK